MVRSCPGRLTTRYSPEGRAGVRQEAESIDRQLGHTMGFRLIKPPELNTGYLAAG
jgi:hypothetical protein